MPTYEYIAKTITTNNTTSSITFSSIPSTYADLVIKWHAQTDNSIYGTPLFSVNGTNNIYNYTLVSNSNHGSANTYALNTTSQTSTLSVYRSTAGVNIANTYADGEIYISNYANQQVGGAKKQGVGYWYQPSTQALSSNAQNITIMSLDIGTTSAISSITFNMGANFYYVNTAYYLYGIKYS